MKTQSPEHDNIIYGAGVPTYLDSKLTKSIDFKIPADAEERLVANNDPGCIGAELLRTLASRLIHAQKLHPLKKVLITSSVQGEGKTVISANLAITLAHLNERVLLVDGDLRSSNLSRWFHVVDDSLIGIYGDRTPNRQALLRKAEGLPLWILPAGKAAGAPVKFLHSVFTASSFAGFELDFDWIIIDSPPLIPFGDAGILSAIADAIVLVTRKAVTPKAMLEEALKGIDRKKIIAAILNGADVKAEKYYHDYYARSVRALPHGRREEHTKPLRLNDR
jgi:capsular exopolysaccharide synthesis family protein